ncbi:thioredoxin-like protein [Podospora didyma]|uniref:Thioredoxin-like protein n=1 Tax=Podospora didyma TaxID=330526 RepID=A0AAE0NYV1_9PEZI|nr:thioredoxin-like protein [Podospora didyma]
MRLSLSLLFGAAALAAAVSTSDEADDEELRENTYFNGQKVPPVLELTPHNWEKETNASKYLMVKHFSPSCGHCIAFAPTYQTLYEFYYTSRPAGAGNEKKDFTTFYDFRFAEINCIAYSDLCGQHNVASWPTTNIYKNGEQVASVRGGKSLAHLSTVLEDVLEKEKPGTRPATIDLPLAGANTSPAYDKVNPPKKIGKAKEDNEDLKLSEKTTAAAAAAAAATPAAEAASEAKAQTPFIPNKSPKLTKPVSTFTPNPNGTSFPLNADTFMSKVTLTQEPWFIKFYAPWCHHCQAMAPNWEQMAKEMKGKLNIGEVDCDANSRLCKDARLKGYPTILFFKGGERVEYDGLRGLGDFVHYAEKAMDVTNGVLDVDAATFKEVEAKEDVVFVYFYDHATTTEDFMALERLPLSLIGRAKLVKTQDPKMFERFKITTWPRLVASREGRPTYYTPLTPNEMRDTHRVLNWMKSVWLPIVPELTASNAREIMDGKIVVLGILNRQDDEAFQTSRREMKSAANEWMDKQITLFQQERQDLRDSKQLRIEEAEDRNDQRALRAAKGIRINMDKSDHKEVAFAWVDGVFWQRWIRTTYGIDAKDGERVIINDEDNRRYWDQTITGNNIVPSRTSILETLNKVTAPGGSKIKPKLTISRLEKVFFDIRMTFVEHPYLSAGCVLGVLFGCASWFRGRIRRTRGHFRLDNSSGEYKAPLHGATINGSKKD